MKIAKYYDLFVGKSEEDQLDIMEKMVSDAGFNLSIAYGYKGCVTYFFSKDGVDNVFAIAYNSVGASLPVIMPVDFAKRHYMTGNSFTKSIKLGTHSYMNKKVTPVLDYNGKKNAKLHRVLMQELGYDIEGLEVDHISNHQGVNIPSELRPCTSSQNKANKINTKVKNGEFTYNPEHDFRESFYIPFLHYVLGVISYEGMHILRSMELVVKQLKVKKGQSTL